MKYVIPLPIFMQRYTREQICFLVLCLHSLQNKLWTHTIFKNGCADWILAECVLVYKVLVVLTAAHSVGSQDKNYVITVDITKYVSVLWCDTFPPYLVGHHQDKRTVFILSTVEMHTIQYVNSWPKWILKFGPVNTGIRGPGSSVGIGTGYGLDGSGVESRRGRDFPHLPRPALEPINLLHNGYRVFPRGRKRPGRDADTSPPSAEV
jgi:hypothetical protein